MRDWELRKSMLDAMDAIADDIVIAEAMANELAHAAAALSDQTGFKAIREAALRWRVKAIKLRGQLAAHREQYEARFPPEA